MRNRLIHAYTDVDLDVLWETVMDDLPSLIHMLEKIVSEGRLSVNSGGYAALRGRSPASSYHLSIVSNALRHAAVSLYGPFFCHTGSSYLS